MTEGIARRWARTGGRQRTTVMSLLISPRLFLSDFAGSPPPLAEPMRPFIIGLTATRMACEGAEPTIRAEHEPTRARRARMQRIEKRRSTETSTRAAGARSVETSVNAPAAKVMVRAGDFATT